MLRIRAVVAAGTLLAIAIVGTLIADITLDHHDSTSVADNHRAVHERHMDRLKSPTSPPGSVSDEEGVVPASPGQDAFGAVQEIVKILEADPATDWTHVNLDALREHLIDMNRVTLGAKAEVTPADNGLRIDISGSGRTLEAIQRMVPAHANELNRLPNWNAHVNSLENGIRLTVTSPDAAEAAKIRGLGFIGLMASGAHHQVHHLAIAKGEHIH